MLDNVKTQLTNRNWTGSSTRVFGTGSIAVTTAIDAETALRVLRVPLALIIPGNFQSDPQHNGQQPDLLVGMVTLRLAVAIPGDAVGENAMMDGNRPSATASEGAGLLRLEQEVHAAIGLLNAQDASITIQFKRSGDSGAIAVNPSTYLAYQDLTFEAVCTAT